MSDRPLKDRKRYSSQAIVRHGPKRVISVAPESVFEDGSTSRRFSPVEDDNVSGRRSNVRLPCLHGTRDVLASFSYSSSQTYRLT